ncbi:hypothetical protein ACFVRR_15905 [Gottfriedia sp. NPDC057948]|uniref:hypothetical protein n=1 Tax=Gottfriedia sp. NPDC057948 TaxID=3346287 RepID=UPI0036DAA7BC
MKKAILIVCLYLPLLLLLEPYTGGVFDLHFNKKKAANIASTDKIIRSQEIGDGREVILYKFKLKYRPEEGGENEGFGVALIKKKLGFLYQFDSDSSSFVIEKDNPFVYSGYVDSKEQYIFAIKTAKSSQIQYIAITDQSKHNQFSLSEARANHDDYKVMEVKDHYALLVFKSFLNEPELVVRGFDSKGNLVAEQRGDGIAKYVNKPNKSKNKIVIENNRITTNGFDQIFAYINGNRIFWEGEQKGNFDIYMYDLNTKLKTRIISGGSDYAALSISGNRIVWQDNRNGNYDIYMYDIASKKERQITTDKNDQMFPDIDGNQIVYEDSRNGNEDIYMYDLNTNKEKQITVKSNDETSPYISGNRIVWEDEGNVYAGEINTKIYMYDIATKSISHISMNDSAQYGPIINGNRIVWVDSLGGPNTIYMYDLSTKKESKITQNDNIIHSLYRIDNNHIIWEDNRTGKYNIYIYDLNTKKETEIPIRGLDEFNFSISANTIVFSKDWKDNKDIYLYNLNIQ